MVVDPAEQILPSSFEHALNVLIGQEVSLVAFDRCFRNDEVGAPIYRYGGAAQGRAARAHEPVFANLRGTSQRLQR
jgi:hypothetical protein